MSSKYLFLYSGGEMPQSEAAGKAMMAAWMAWFGKAGSAIVDGGAPFAAGSRRFGKATASGATGYSIVQAESAAAAAALTEGHPHLAHGGGIEIFELAKIPGM
ncbi:MAG: hypothetical protein ABR970_05370 [Roseiarcus sp.]|jgi:hypothetical protein